MKAIALNGSVAGRRGGQGSQISILEAGLHHSNQYHITTSVQQKLPMGGARIPDFDFGAWSPPLESIPHNHVGPTETPDGGDGKDPRFRFWGLVSTTRIITT
jgi:hypothetical protein